MWVGRAVHLKVTRLKGREIIRLQGKVTSVGAVEAVRRLNECRPPNTPHVMEPKLLFEIRNEALHMGLAPSADDLEAALNELVTLVDSVFKIRRTLYLVADWGEFWSQKHLRIVEARQKTVYEQLLARFSEAIADAKVDYDRLIAGLGQDERNRLVAELMARQPEIDDEQTLRAHKCPACQNSLWVMHNVERRIEEDDSDAPHSFGLFAKVSAYVDSATCPVCDLTLSQAELVLTDIDFVLDLGQDETTADEEEGWRDARDEEDREMRGDYDPAPTTPTTGWTTKRTAVPERQYRSLPVVVSFRVLDEGFRHAGEQSWLRRFMQRRNAVAPICASAPGHKRGDAGYSAEAYTALLSARCCFTGDFWWHGWYCLYGSSGLYAMEVRDACFDPFSCTQARYRRGFDVDP
jgi:hypothetical protein